MRTNWSTLIICAISLLTVLGCALGLCWATVALIISLV